MWTKWNRFFLSMAAEVSQGQGLPPAPPPLEGVAERIATSSVRYCGPLAYARDEALLAEVRSIGYSSWEERLVALEDDAPLYAGFDYDFTRRNIGDYVAVTLRSQHAYEVWQDLDVVLSPLQRIAMQEWYERMREQGHQLWTPEPPAVPPASEDS